MFSDDYYGVMPVWLRAGCDNDESSTNLPAKTRIYAMYRFFYIPILPSDKILGNNPSINITDELW